MLLQSCFAFEITENIFSKTLDHSLIFTMCIFLFFISQIEVFFKHNVFAVV